MNRIGTKRKRRGASLAGFITALVAFVVCLVIGWLLLFPSEQARLSGVKTLGTVQDISDCSDGGDSGNMLRSLYALVDIQTNVQPTIQFTDLHGNSYTVVDTICGNYGIGEQVALWYLPSNPNVFSVQDDGVTLMVLLLITAFFGLLALVFVLVGLGRFALLGLLARSGRQNTVGSAGGLAQMGGWPMNSPPLPGGASFGASGHHRLGETVYAGGQWAITLTNAYPSQGAEMIAAAPGRCYLLLLLTLRNTTQEPLSFSQTAFRLTDHMGAEYQRAPLLEGQTPGIVQPGGQVNATLAYDVPGRQRQFQLTCSLLTSSLAQATWDIAV